MQYPLISEYVRAIQDASSNLDKLAHLVPVLDDHGEPYRSSGAFAVVFKMKDEQTGKCYALKCFTEEQEGRAEAYRKIADELECVDSSYITSVKYLEKEIFVDSSCEEDEFPVLLMDWIDGVTMESYIAENYQDNYAMAMLCYRFCKMAAWLRSQPFAHGDIKPDNIMVRPDGSLALVDYDGMFVPAMKGQKSPTIGTKDFSHPQRTIDDFDETIDDFALASIALSLKAISLKPSLLEEYGAADRLLFSAADYRDLSKSKVLAALQELMNDEEVNTFLAMFLFANAKKNIDLSSFEPFVCQQPKNIWENVSTAVTEDELKDAIEDEYGVKYSKDGVKLLNARDVLNVEKYIIKQGTKVIANYAFGGTDLKCIVIPSSVVKMGINPFSECYAAELENQSPYFVYENKMLFSENKSDLISVISDERSYIIPNGVKRIGDSAFDVVEGEERILEEIILPNGVTEIGSCAFERCGMLRSIILPDSITRIGSYAFSDCRNLQSVSMSKNVVEIGESAFDSCVSLCQIQLPSKLKYISKSLFSGCVILDVLIPNGVVAIGEHAFSCTGISKLNIPDSVEEIGDCAFSCCGKLSSLIIKRSKAHIGRHAFDWCQKLKDIEISDSISFLSGTAFEYCDLSSSVYEDLVRRFWEKGFV